MGTILVIWACAGLCNYFIVGEFQSMPSCLTHSQPAAAQWAGDHPTHKIRRILCTDMNRYLTLAGKDKA